MRLFLITILACLCWPAVAWAAGPQDLQQLLDEQLSATANDAGLVGAGGIVLHDGEVVAQSVYGVRRKGKDDPIRADDLWHIGSVTKSMTGTLIGTLVDEGAVGFDDTLPELLPDLAAEMHEGWSAVTLRHLLTHTAGAPANFSMTTQFNWPDSTDELVRERRKQVAAVLKNPPKSAPGAKFVYSNVGFTIAGHVSEAVSGTPYEELMRSRVFEAVGMARAGFGAPTGDNPWGHSVLFGIKTAKDPEKRADNTPIIAPAGTAHMPLKELALYGQHHLDGEVVPDGILLPETYKKLHNPVLNDYASGWVVMERDWAGGRMIWHNGSNTMWYALLLLLPEKNMVMAFTSNDGDYRAAEKAFFSVAKEVALSSSQSGDSLDQ